MPTGPRISLFSLLLACLLCAPGCSVLPDVTHQPVLHNPFPQLSKVAVAPFFNQSQEATVDGRQFAAAYFAELQAIPGYEVVPIGVVETAIIQHRVNLAGPGEARRLAQLLGVDAVVIGTVTDYSPYYPPRCGMRVEWYAANPGFHEIPAGYGLPWGTHLEEYIPDSLVFEAEFALAREQLKTQSPDVNSLSTSLPAPPVGLAPTSPAPPATQPGSGSKAGSASKHGGNEAEPAEPNEFNAGDGRPMPEAAAPMPEELPPPPGLTGDDSVHGAIAAVHLAPAPGATGAAALTAGGGPIGAFPPNWPDARGFLPPGPSPAPPPLLPHGGPVMTHTRIYRGNDPEFTAALASYVSFRDEARFGGWQSYLERSDDFIRFCAHLHLAEMLTARGGGGETRVVQRWSAGR